MTLRFFYNGIKASDGILQKCHYSDAQLINHPIGTITIYGRGYRGFNAEVAAHFTVDNGSDIMTDYFENDRIRVVPEHPLYPQVREALDKFNVHASKRKGA